MYVGLFNKLHTFSIVINVINICCQLIEVELRLTDLIVCQHVKPADSIN